MAWFFLKSYISTRAEMKIRILKIIWSNCPNKYPLVKETKTPTNYHKYHSLVFSRCVYWTVQMEETAWMGDFYPQLDYAFVNRIF